MFSRVNKFDLSLKDEGELSQEEGMQRWKGTLRQGIVAQKQGGFLLCVGSIMQELQFKQRAEDWGGNGWGGKVMKALSAVCGHFIFVEVEDQGRHRVTLGCSLIFLNWAPFQTKQLLPFFPTPDDIFSVLSPSCTSSECLLDFNAPLEMGVQKLNWISWLLPEKDQGTKRSVFFLSALSFHEHRLSVLPFCGKSCHTFDAFECVAN